MSQDYLVLSFVAGSVTHLSTSPAELFEPDLHDPEPGNAPAARLQPRPVALPLIRGTIQLT